MIARPLLLATLAIVLGACAGKPLPDYLARPADPNVNVPAPAYQTVTAGSTVLRPAEPKDWRELNRRVGPQP